MSAPKRKTNQHQPANNTGHKSLNVRIPDTQFEELTAAAEKVNLSVPNTARLAISRGLVVLVAQLTAPPVVEPSAQPS